MLGRRDDVTGIILRRAQTCSSCAPSGFQSWRRPSDGDLCSSRPNVIPHVIDEHTIFDEHISTGWLTLVVKRPRTPLAINGAVVDERHQRRRNKFADSTRIHTRTLRNVVGLNPWPQASWNSTCQYPAQSPPVTARKEQVEHEVSAPLVLRPRLRDQRANNDRRPPNHR